MTQSWNNLQKEIYASVRIKMKAVSSTQRCKLQLGGGGYYRKLLPSNINKSIFIRFIQKLLTWNIKYVFSIPLKLNYEYLEIDAGFSVCPELR